MSRKRSTAELVEGDGEAFLFQPARRVAKTLTPGARVVMSRLKERSVLALSLAEMAMVIEPGLPGLVLPMKDPDVRAARWDPSRTSEVLEHDDTQRALLYAAIRGTKEPIQQRLLPDGGLLPALEGNPAWGRAMERARAIVVELETLRLVARVEVRGTTVSEKWTLTEEGKKVCKELSIQEWRERPGKKPG